MKKICKRCKKMKEHKAKGLCHNCYHKTNYTQINGLGCDKSFCIYTNGVTKEIKPLIPLIRNNVLNDCINNPRKYLK